MNLYEHTIIARQDVSPTQLKQIQDKYSKIVEKNDGNVVKLENWGLMTLSYLIKTIPYKIKKKDILISNLYEYSEILLVGSGKGVVSISSIDQLNWYRSSLKMYKSILKEYSKVL